MATGQLKLANLYLATVQKMGVTSVLDMGNSILDHGVPLAKKLSVRNTGDKPLIVSRIESDCACSVASFDGSSPVKMIHW